MRSPQLEFTALSSFFSSWNLEISRQWLRNLGDFAMSSGLGFSMVEYACIISIFRESLPTLQRGRGTVSVKALKSVPNSDTIVAADESYGREEVISVDPRLYDYLLANVREPKILRELREETATMRGSQMQVSSDQVQLLAMLVQILGAKKCIEVGVYTVRVGDVIVMDNVLCHGRVADPLVNDSKTVHIRNFNRNLMEDHRVPIGDGMTICRRLS